MLKIGKEWFFEEGGNCGVVGEIVYDRETYHSPRYIFPAGYESTKMYQSTQEPMKKVVYRNYILDGGDTPVVSGFFRVRAVDFCFSLEVGSVFG